MNWLVYHIAAGHAFFSGVALVMIALIASLQTRPLGQRFSMLALLIGGLAIAISSTPLPYWYYGVALILTIWWRISVFLGKGHRWSTIFAALIWMGSVGLELPYHVVPKLRPASAKSMTVLGDSITAGMGESDRSIRWPTLLATEQNIEIRDLSRPGETVASALKRAKSQPIVSPIVILEIGGNDLFGDTTLSNFHSDLDALLAYVSAKNRQVVMLELPLPPFQNELGRIQRSLARKYGVVLIPKRVLLSVLAATDSTVDTIHLTQAGHRRMAATVWNLVKPAFLDIQ